MTRGGVIEEEDGGVVTESLHKPSQEKRNSFFGGNTTQSRSFKVLEETMAAGIPSPFCMHGLGLFPTFCMKGKVKVVSAL